MIGCDKSVCFKWSWSEGSDKIINRYWQNKTKKVMQYVKKKYHPAEKNHDFQLTVNYSDENVFKELPIV